VDEVGVGVGVLDVDEGVGEEDEVRDEVLVEVGVGVGVDVRRVDEERPNVVVTVVRTVVVPRLVYVAVMVAVPPRRTLLQTCEASAVWSLNASSPHWTTITQLACLLW